MQKLIFLDIDGVIAAYTGNRDLTDKCQNHLEYILKYTKAKIVITSSWRKHAIEETIEHLRNHGFRSCEHIIGQTIRAYHYVNGGIHLSIPRGVEIKQWIDTNIHSKDGIDFNRKKIGKDFNYVIIDDDTDMLLEHKDHFVHTNGHHGLTKYTAYKAISILNKFDKKCS